MPRGVGAGIEKPSEVRSSCHFPVSSQSPAFEFDELADYTSILSICRFLLPFFGLNQTRGEEWSGYSKQETKSLDSDNFDMSSSTIAMENAGSFQPSFTTCAELTRLKGRSPQGLYGRALRGNRNYALPVGLMLGFQPDWLAGG